MTRGACCAAASTASWRPFSLQSSSIPICLRLSLSVSSPALSLAVVIVDVVANDDEEVDEGGGGA